MLDRAFERFPIVNGLVFHSDQGWQYQHAYYRNRLSKHGIIQSMSRKGTAMITPLWKHSSEVGNILFFSRLTFFTT